MKFAEELYPKGTFDGQQTSGAYISDTLARNLDVMAWKINQDMTFLGIISGHDMVGNGKTTLLTQIGTYLTWKINQLHKTENTFTDKNVCMNSKDLTKSSFELPKYSVLGLDEGDDLTTHGMKEMAVRLKRYFRKCRQLNQILILILPSFFELPKFYALSRSHFLIDVEFKNAFERGFFKFYGPKGKKMLYLKGKKEWDYNVWNPDFKGRFFASYCFFPDLEGCVKKYKAKKLQDMMDDTEERDSMSYEQIEKRVTKEVFVKVYTHLKGKITQDDLAAPFHVTKRTLQQWLFDEKEREKGDASLREMNDEENNLILTKNENDVQMVAMIEKGGINTDEIETEVTPPTN